VKAEGNKKSCNTHVTGEHCLEKVKLQMKHADLAIEASMSQAPDGSRNESVRGHNAEVSGSNPRPDTIEPLA
jgi:hypothetical protein